MASGGNTRSAKPTAGWMRRANRSRPAAFWARAPAFNSSSSNGISRACASIRAARAARWTCSAVSRNCAMVPARSSPGGVSPFRFRRQSSARWAASGIGASQMKGTSRAHAGSHVRAPTRMTVAGISEKARTAGRPLAIRTSIGPATTPAPVRPASLAVKAATIGRSSSGRSRSRSRASVGRPTRVKALEASAAPDAPGRSRI